MAKKPVANTEVVEEIVDTEIVAEPLPLTGMIGLSDTPLRETYGTDNCPYNLNFSTADHHQNIRKGNNNDN